MQKVPFELFRFASKCRQMFRQKKKEKEKGKGKGKENCLDKSFRCSLNVRLISVNGIGEFDAVERCFA